VLERYFAAVEALEGFDGLGAQPRGVALDLLHRSLSRISIVPHSMLLVS
jgi:hypothetical protein